MRNRVARAGGAAILAVVLLGGCADDPEPLPEEDRPSVGVPGVEDTEGPPGEEPDVPDDVPVDDLLADVEAFAGDDVSVTGEVAEVLTEQAFTLAATDASGSPLLVVTSDTGGIEAGSQVSVTGAFEDDFRVPDAEAFLAIDLEESELGDLEGQPYLAAEDVEQAG